MNERYDLFEELTDEAEVWLNNLADMTAIVQEQVNFITAGYSNGALTDDITKGMLYVERINEETGEFATVTIAGVPTVCDKMYLRVYTANPKNPYRSFNGPTVAGAYRCRAIYTKPNGEDYIVKSWTEVWK